MKEICNLKKLTQLDLSENKVERLPDELGNMQSLSDLLLSQNQLDYLPDSIGKCLVHLNTVVHNLILWISFEDCNSGSHSSHN
jgi:Leucine-rich repeat (LRR) protein